MRVAGSGSGHLPDLAGAARRRGQRRDLPGRGGGGADRGPGLRSALGASRSARPGDRRGGARAGAWPGAGARGAGGTPRRPGRRPAGPAHRLPAPGRATRPAPADPAGRPAGARGDRARHPGRPARPHGAAATGRCSPTVRWPSPPFRGSCATSRPGSTSTPSSWSTHCVEDLRRVADDAQDLLDDERRACLVHSDLNAKNLLVDPETLEVTGVLDWELAHSGLPWTDLGNLLRFDRHPVLVEAVLSAYTAFMPAVPDDLLDRARAADLFALVELASRRGRERSRRTGAGTPVGHRPHRGPACCPVGAAPVVSAAAPVGRSRPGADRLRGSARSLPESQT